MSIPERLYRLAKGKIGELREIFDKDDSDVEMDPELLARIQRSQARSSARKELQDAVDYGTPAAPGPAPAVGSGSETRSLRTPDQIRGSSPTTSAGSPSSQSRVNETDPLAPHYRLLGLEPGADYAAVQAVYEKLASRCQPERFPAGSREALEATDIRNRLEATYKVLREALDPTSRRFELLEL